MSIRTDILVAKRRRQWARAQKQLEGEEGRRLFRYFITYHLRNYQGSSQNEPQVAVLNKWTERLDKLVLITPDDGGFVIQVPGKIYIFRNVKLPDTPWLHIALLLSIYSTSSRHIIQGAQMN